jgi:hypothetical protein
MNRSGACIIALCLVLGLPIASTALAQVFDDQFDGASIDLSKWNVNLGGGTIIVAGGRATLSAPCGAQFPYLTIKTNPFPATGDFLIRVGFRYPDVEYGGNGFGFDYVQRGFGVWQDRCCGPLRVAVGDLYPVYPPGLPSPDTTYHVYEWDYIEGTYYFFLDGHAVAANTTSFRPTTLFFGHPPYSYCPWTTQEIDFVHVEPIVPLTARSASWSRLKAIYRR